MDSKDSLLPPQDTARIGELMIDLTTLYLIATMIAFLLGGMLLYIGRKQKLDALNWWGDAYLLGAAAVVLWVVGREFLGDPPALALEAVGMIACAMIWNAARLFHGKQPHWPGQFIGALVWISAVFALPESAVATRLTIGAAIVATYAILTAVEIGTERRKSMQRKWPAVLAPLLHGSAIMLPILLADLLAPPEDFTSSIWVTIFAVELVLYGIGNVFVIFMLVSERTVRAHKTAAMTDPLTGLFNRRGFSEVTTRMIEAEATAGRPVSVMIFDIDHFKSVNDRFGHPAGDELLKLFATLVTNTLRATDLSGRIGGEEFAALLPCSLGDAAIAAERVRKAFETCGLVVDGEPISTTVSIGVSSGPPLTDLNVLLAAADTALYKAKRGGRNQIHVLVEEPISLSAERRVSAVATNRPKQATTISSNGITVAA